MKSNIYTIHTLKKLVFESQDNCSFYAKTIYCLTVEIFFIEKKFLIHKYMRIINTINAGHQVYHVQDTDTCV